MQNIYKSSHLSEDIPGLPDVALDSKHTPDTISCKHVPRVLSEYLGYRRRLLNEYSILWFCGPMCWQHFLNISDVPTPPSSLASSGVWDLTIQNSDLSVNIIITRKYTAYSDPVNLTIDVSKYTIYNLIWYNHNVIVRKLFVCVV